MVEFIAEYGTLALVSILAFLSPVLAKRLRTPVVVTELVFGVIIGGVFYLLQTYTSLLAKDAVLFSDSLRFLAKLGLVFLLFLAGLEFDFQILRERGPRPLLTGFIVFLLTFGLGMVMMYPLGLGNIFILAIIMSTTSVGVVIPTLRELGGIDRYYRQNIIISALVADFATMLLLVFVPFVKEGDFQRIAITSGIYIPAVFIIFFIAYRVGASAMWHFPKFLSRWFHSKDPAEIGVRASFMFLFIFIIISLALGIDPILGAFLAGILLSLLFQEGALLSKKLFGLGYGFFIPVFFIFIGTSFDFSLLGSYKLLWMVPILAMGLLNSARLTLLIAAVTLAKEYDLIGDELYSAFILLSIVLCVVSPTLFKKLIDEGPSEGSEGDLESEGKGVDSLGK